MYPNLRSDVNRQRSRNYHFPFCDNNGKFVALRAKGLWSSDSTGCHRRNGPNFGRVFLMLNYIDITQNTYIQS